MDSPSFTTEELKVLRDMVEEWIGEGFTTPPYTDSQYSIFEKLNVTGPSYYDIRRPLTLR